MLRDEAIARIVTTLPRLSDEFLEALTSGLHDGVYPHELRLCQPDEGAKARTKRR